MPLSITRKLFLAALPLFLIGVAIAVASASEAGSDPSMGTLIGMALLAIGWISLMVSWVGALIRLAKLGRWGWFVFVLLLSGPGMIAYVIVGPGEQAIQQLGLSIK